jgi:hypothetical protein
LLLGLLAGGLGPGSVALRLGHFREALALAGVLTLAGVVGGLAGRMALAGIHAFALDLGFIGGTGSAHHDGREHYGSGGSQSNAGHFSAVHLESLLEVISNRSSVLDEPSSLDRSLPDA